MKKEDLIALGIGEEEAKAIMTMHGKTVTVLNNQVNSLEAERNSLQEQTIENEKQLESLKESAAGNEDLTKQLSEMQASLANTKTEAEQMLQDQKKGFAIKLALKESKTLDEDIVANLLDKETIKISDEGVQGLKEQLETLRESKPFLFEPAANEAAKGYSVGGPARGGNTVKEADAFEAAAQKYT